MDIRRSFPKINIIVILILFFLFSETVFPESALSQPPHSYKKIPVTEFLPISDSISKIMMGKAELIGTITVDTAYLSKSKKGLQLHFSRTLGENPIRDEDVSLLYNIAKSLLPDKYKKLKLELFSMRTKLEDLSSPYFSGRQFSDIIDCSGSSDEGNTLAKIEAVNKWVTPLSIPVEITNGLQERHIALWQSHGYYYEQSLLRWEWQRSRVFETVEDLFTQSYVLPFIVPMLENAGACVALPRERDYQKEEIIVDNCGEDYYEYTSNTSKHWEDTGIEGFANPKSVYVSGENPFKMGNARKIVCQNGTINHLKHTSFACWRPTFTKSDRYAVYVSYQSLENSSDCVYYTVTHLGGNTLFKVNQQIGGGTWVYLGTFNFPKGKSDYGVVLHNLSTSKSGSDNVVVADAVKFGGGMGNIARKPANHLGTNGYGFVISPIISGYPRYAEAARYWLQWAGFPNEVYSQNSESDDYKDDYKSRGSWVNALSDGYKIPIDLSLALHSDAGISLTDSIIGTLSIYTRFSENSDLFPNKLPRISSRELSDMIQTQLVTDIRSSFEPNWTRRGLWDRSYFESRQPNVPSLLLELLSHQNFADMRYGLDPNFKFTVSRAIYKGILKFLSFKNNIPYVVQPLPINSFSATITNDGRNAHLEWKPTIDTLETSANPESFIIYTRIVNLLDISNEKFSREDLRAGNSSGFDNGVVVKGNSCLLPIQPGLIYSYKVVAINSGGCSFPSETLSLSSQPSADTDPHSGKVLIVNGFDRISAPASFATKDSTRAGFCDYIDAGVGYIKDYSYVGNQFQFDRSAFWTDDDSPGFGASNGDYETSIVAGNSFDYPFVHGIAFAKKGIQFESCSRDGLINGDIDITNYKVIDLIMGKQISTQIGRKGASKIRFEVFPIKLQNILTHYCLTGKGNLLLSGSYIATDVWDGIYENTRKMLYFDQREKIKASLIKITPNTDSLLSIFNKKNEELKLIDSICKPLQQSRDFVKNTFKYQWISSKASATGVINPAPNPYGIGKQIYSIFTHPNSTVYSVNSPDGIIPCGKNSWTIFRYGDNNISAGVASKGESYKSVSLGFPIEALHSQYEIDTLIGEIIDFFFR